MNVARLSLLDRKAGPFMLIHNNNSHIDVR